MKDGGRTDEYAPDSSLDAEEPGQYYQVADGKFVLIHLNDFVDLDENAIPLDPIWGSSFQVMGLEPTEIIVRMLDVELDLYKPVNVSPELINNSYVRSPHLDEVP
jgi:hypothetical protein